MSEGIKNLNMNIVVDDGSRRVPILNTEGEEIGAFRFHPTDIGIIERYNALAGRFDGITEPLDGVASGEDGGDVDVSGEPYIAALKEAERRLCAAVDELLGAEGAAAAFFGKMHPFSPVNGEFYCTQVLNVLGQFIGAQFERETAQFSARAKQYANRAQRRAK
ncbi:MAG: hypothetical protein IJ124_14155 [Clostridia bacterium]|nr:hypothetical protein [Clostridia bacterium]